MTPDEGLITMLLLPIQIPNHPRRGAPATKLRRWLSVYDVVIKKIAAPHANCTTPKASKSTRQAAGQSSATKPSPIQQAFLIQHMQDPFHNFIDHPVHKQRRHAIQGRRLQIYNDKLVAPGNPCRNLTGRGHGQGRAQTKTKICFLRVLPSTIPALLWQWVSKSNTRVSQDASTSCPLANSTSLSGCRDHAMVTLILCPTSWTNFDIQIAMQLTQSARSNPRFSVQTVNILGHDLL
mmetsp:Transcript_47309/g.107302  ORF Transcript_47309/g.107302 Transcript_47309/m.107302 type:complete len:236 (+) Transcript_47309:824-1531(+)